MNREDSQLSQRETLDDVIQLAEEKCGKELSRKIAFQWLGGSHPVVRENIVEHIIERVFVDQEHIHPFCDVIAAVPSTILGTDQAQENRSSASSIVSASWNSSTRKGNQSASEPLLALRPLTSFGKSVSGCIIARMDPNRVLQCFDGRAPVSLQDLGLRSELGPRHSCNGQNRRKTVAV
jgi:hypothetical protein